MDVTLNFTVKARTLPAAIETAKQRIEALGCEPAHYHLEVTAESTSRVAHKDESWYFHVEATKYLFGPGLGR